MVEKIFTQENKPFPNNPVPILYYPHAFSDKLDAEQALAHFEKNRYSNGWVNGIFPYHHFHSNTHEVLACIAGQATVQLGGPDALTLTFEKGDVVLLPAGTAHKRLDATADFKIVGAYPDGLEPDMQTGEAKDYQAIKERIAAIPFPEIDPVEGRDFLSILKVNR